MVRGEDACCADEDLKRVAVKRKGIEEKRFAKSREGGDLT